MVQTVGYVCDGEGEEECDDVDGDGADLRVGRFVAEFVDDSGNEECARVTAGYDAWVVVSVRSHNIWMEDGCWDLPKYANEPR